MKPILIIAGIVLIVVFISWLNYNKRLQSITHTYKNIAEQEGGEVETGGLSLRPRLKLWYQGTPVLISHAYTGTLSAKPGYYTFAQICDLPTPTFQFRIAPTSKLDPIDLAWLRHKLESGIPELDSTYTFSCSLPALLDALLTPELVEILIAWGQGSSTNGIEDIHNEDDKLVFSIYGMPEDHTVYDRLLESVKTLLKAYLAANANPDRLKSAVAL